MVVRVNAMFSSGKDLTDKIFGRIASGLSRIWNAKYMPEG
jgi:hypothetical protein